MAQAKDKAPRRVKRTIQRSRARKPTPQKGHSLPSASHLASRFIYQTAVALLTEVSRGHCSRRVKRRLTRLYPPRLFLRIAALWRNQLRLALGSETRQFVVRT